MVHDLRALLRLAVGRTEQPSAAIFDGHTLQSTPEGGQRAGYDGHKRKNGIELMVVKLPEVKKGFVLLPKRWVVERGFAWAARFRRPERGYERLPETLVGLHFLAFAMVMLKQAVHLLTQSS